MRVLVTGGSGVLGRATIPLLRVEGHGVEAPSAAQLDLFDAVAVRRAVEGASAILHLATRIPPRARATDKNAWRDNDRLRADASRLLVDAALASETETYVQPSVAFLYPAEGLVDEGTPLAEISRHLRSALTAERETARFAAAGRRGVVLRLGLLDGPGTCNDVPDQRYGCTLHADCAGRVLAAALELPSGVYNVCRDGERVSNQRFKRLSGWRPER
jgi:nucleoside-diphosphate-sugar epimerase